MPEPSPVVVIVRLLGEMLMEPFVDFVWTGEPLSLAVTVKLDVSAVVGVPEIVPFDKRVRPAGRLPEVIVHV